MTVVEPSIATGRVPDGFVTDTIADRLATLMRSLEGYDLASNGVRDEIVEVIPGVEGHHEKLDSDAIANIVEHLDADEVAAVWYDVVRVLRRRRLDAVLSLHGVPYPHYPVGDDTPTTPPVVIWDPPRLSAPSPGGWSVLGFDVGFPVGIPSCELTCNADWLEYYARKGFHVLTYRTVRNRPTERGYHDWVFLADIRQPWEPAASPTEVRHAEGPVPPDIRRISTATSFAAPCPPRTIWEADVRDARARLDRLGGRHLLIVSVTDSVPKEEKSIETLTEDFVKVARRAESAGAQAVECYLARATIRDEAGGLSPCERSAETSIAIVDAVRDALDRKTRLLIKLSAELSQENLERIVVDLASRRRIDGVSGISPVQVDRVNTGSDGHRLWDGRRPGVAGYALRALSLDFVTRLAAIRSRYNLEFDIIAMGGVMTAEDIAMHMGLGAAAVQMATAAVCDPDLAETAYAHYRSSLQTTELWDGVVTDVDPDTKTFWARVTAANIDAEDMDAQFEFEEVHPHQRSEVFPGAFFRWTTGLVEDSRRLVRHSSVRFWPPEAPSKDDIEAGKRLARRIVGVPGPKLDIG